MAVDFNKSGVPAIMEDRLKVVRWPHFMEKTHLGPEKTRKSKGVLGQLYDRVERKAFVPAYKNHFDARILDGPSPSSAILQQVRVIKSHYDRWMRRTMAQNSIMSEFEVWSTFALSHDCEFNDYKFAEEFGRVSAGLKDHWRKIVIQEAGGSQFDKLAPWATAMYIVTKLESDEKLAKLQDKHGHQAAEAIIGAPVSLGNPHELPLISFPWLFADTLGEIALRFEGKSTTIPSGRPWAATHGMAERPFAQPQHILDQPLEISYANGAVQHRGEIIDCFNNNTAVPKAEPDAGSSRPWQNDDPKPGSDALRLGEELNLMDFDLFERETESYPKMQESQIPVAKPLNPQAKRSDTPAGNDLGELLDFGEQVDPRLSPASIEPITTPKESFIEDPRRHSRHLDTTNIGQTAPLTPSMSASPPNPPDPNNPDPRENEYRLRRSLRLSQRLEMIEKLEGPTDEDAMVDDCSEDGEVVELGPSTTMSMLDRLESMMG